MCTVTFLPREKRGFILTANRDEQPHRPLAEPPRRYYLPTGIIIYPRDPPGQGTWIATNGTTLSVCLLNGAFTGYIPAPPYRRSRGLVVLDFFAFGTAAAFISGYEFSGIEPFTLVVLQAADQLSLLEIRWDGSSVHLLPKKATQPHIWSSVTLYPPAVRLYREQWFAKFLSAKDRPEKAILSFHCLNVLDTVSPGRKLPKGQAHQTVSITSIQADDAGVRIITYHDLIRQTNQSYRIF